jgi:hypothetical protein
MTDLRTTNDGATRLPANRAFLLRFEERACLPGSVTGRVEHVTSGAVAHFDTLEALLAFVAAVLRDTDRSTTVAR